jgi:hypothetical protein
MAIGALWTLAYNFVWGVTWFAFMRQDREAVPWAGGDAAPLREYCEA